MPISPLNRLFAIGAAGSRYFALPLHSYTNVIYSRYRPSGDMDFKFDCSSWPPDHFKDALRVLTRNLIFKVSLPNWATKLTERIRRVNLEFNELKVPFYV